MENNTNKKYASIPTYMIENMKDYVKYGTDLFLFSEAIFTNNLYDLITHGANFTMVEIRLYRDWMLENAPTKSYGSYENMKIWKKYVNVNASESAKTLARDGKTRRLSNLLKTMDYEEIAELLSSSLTENKEIA